MGLLVFFNQNQISEKFNRLICSYDENSINIVLSKDELIKGFKKIDSVKCIEELNIQSLWFVLRRDNTQSKPIIIEFENRNQVPELLESIKHNDSIEFTIICNTEFIQRRTKIIKISN